VPKALVVAAGVVPKPPKTDAVDLGAVGPNPEKLFAAGCDDAVPKLGNGDAIVVVVAVPKPLIAGVVDPNRLPAVEVAG